MIYNNANAEILLAHFGNGVAFKAQLARNCYCFILTLVVPPLHPVVEAVLV
jgi:hypothetical protein